MGIINFGSSNGVLNFGNSSLQMTDGYYEWAEIPTAYINPLWSLTNNGLAFEQAATPPANKLTDGRR